MTPELLIIVGGGIVLLTLIGSGTYVWLVEKNIITDSYALRIISSFILPLLFVILLQYPNFAQMIINLAQEPQPAPGDYAPPPGGGDAPPPPGGGDAPPPPGGGDAPPPPGGGDAPPPPGDGDAPPPPGGGDAPPPANLIPEEEEEERDAPPANLMPEEEEEERDAPLAPVRVASLLGGMAAEFEKRFHAKLAPAPVREDITDEYRQLTKIDPMTTYLMLGFKDSTLTTYTLLQENVMGILRYGRQASTLFNPQTVQQNPNLHDATVNGIERARRIVTSSHSQFRIDIEGDPTDPTPAAGVGSRLLAKGEVLDLE